MEEKKNVALKAEEDQKTAVESAYDYLEHFDILETITNVGNDEVFTPRKTCEMILDSLPEEVWHNPDYKWLNPATKNGIFEREIAIRLDAGLTDVIPDKETRRKHILQHMIYAIGQTKFTSYVARRTLYYCSDANRQCDGKKAPDGHYVNGYAIGNGTWFDGPEGNILTPKANHEFGKDGKCIFCRMSKDSKYVDMLQREQYAYEFIHHKPEELLTFLQDIFFKGDRNMKFDIIIGNPPYQLADGGSKASARPIYQLFVQNAIALNPKYLSMIIPARWYAGGKGLDDFRKSMIQDKCIKRLVDFPNAKFCFPNCSISGGVCYFLRDRDYQGECTFVSYQNENRPTKSKRYLEKYDIVLRYNEAIPILEKVAKASKSLFSSLVSTRNPFGFASSIRGKENAFEGSVKLFSSDGVSYVGKEEVKNGLQYLESFKILQSTLTAEHANEASSDGQYRVLSTLALLKPGECCTDSYLVIGPFESENIAKNCLSYLKTSLVRFLIMMRISSIHVTRDSYNFVPLVDFNESWNDEKLFAHFGLSPAEISFIKSLVKEH